MPKRQGHGFTTASTRNGSRKRTDVLCDLVEGFPAGRNQPPPETAPYDPDFLTNYESGGRRPSARFAGTALSFIEKWKKFQFAFLGRTASPSSRMAGTRSERYRDRHQLRSGGLSLNAAAAYTDAKTKGNICKAGTDLDPTAPGTEDVRPAPSGSRLPVTPRFKASATARYTWPVWAGRKAHVQGALSIRAPRRRPSSPRSHSSTPRAHSRRRTTSKASCGCVVGRPVRGL